MTDRIFVDTNIFIYLFSKSDEEKRGKCREFFNKADINAQFVVSIQVINEFTAVMLQKFKIPTDEVKSIIDVMSSFELVEIDLSLIKSALDIKNRNQLSYWDSLIVSAAKSAHCNSILTEDLNSGQIIEEMEVLNPMKF